MRHTKEEREQLERKFNPDYDNPLSNCEGAFYIWNKVKTEV